MKNLGRSVCNKKTVMYLIVVGMCIVFIAGQALGFDDRKCSQVIKALEDHNDDLKKQVDDMNKILDALKKALQDKKKDLKDLNKIKDLIEDYLKLDKKFETSDKKIDGIEKKLDTDCAL